VRTDREDHRKTRSAGSSPSSRASPLVSHIRKGKAGRAGPVYIPLGGAFEAGGHTRKYPAGAVRGQHKAHD